VFVFTANDQKKYVFRSEHKNKKKQWVRYLNDAAKGTSLHPGCIDRFSFSPPSCGVCERLF
jgi:hypothetical protein